MAGTADSSSVRLSHPKPSGKMVKFVLGRSIRGAALPPGDQILPVGINGFDYSLKFGEVNEVPEEVLQAVLDSKSRTVTIDPEKAAKHPRPIGELKVPSAEILRTEQVNDYEVYPV